MNYAKSLYEDPDSTLDDIREAVTTLEDAARIARRVLGVAHPTTTEIEDCLGHAAGELINITLRLTHYLRNRGPFSPASRIFRT